MGELRKKSDDPPCCFFFCCCLYFVISIVFFGSILILYGLSLRAEYQASLRGTVTFHVSRIMSMQDTTPDLKLEIKTYNDEWHSGRFNRSFEVDVTDGDEFENFGWHDAILFRLRDMSRRNNPTLATLALSPSQIDSGIKKIYHMSPPSNWLVMRLTWESK